MNLLGVAHALACAKSPSISKLRFEQFLPKTPYSPYTPSKFIKNQTESPKPWRQPCKLIGYLCLRKLFRKSFTPKTKRFWRKSKVLYGFTWCV